MTWRVRLSQAALLEETPEDTIREAGTCSLEAQPDGKDPNDSSAFVYSQREESPVVPRIWLVNALRGYFLKVLTGRVIPGPFMSHLTISRKG
jgi:hypothetical protein